MSDCTSMDHSEASSLSNKAEPPGECNIHCYYPAIDNSDKIIFFINGQLMEMKCQGQHKDIAS